MADFKKQLSRERQKFQLIQEITRAVGSTLDLDAVLRLIVEKVTELMDAERSTLYVLDSQAGELWTRVLQADEVREIRLRVGEGVAGWVAEHGELVNIRDAYADDRFSRAWDQKTGYRTQAILCVPMLDHVGRVTGAIQVLNKKDGDVFSEQDAELAQAVASQASIAIETSRLFSSLRTNNEQLRATQDALQRRVQELDLLVDAQAKIAEAATLDGMLGALLEIIAQRIGAEAASVALCDGETGRFYFRAAIGERSEAVTQLKIKMGEGVAGWVIAEGTPARVDDATTDCRHNPAIAEQVGFGVRNLLCVPLTSGDVSIGAIELLNRVGGDHFDENDERLLMLVADRLAAAIALAQAADQQQRENRLASIGQMLSGVLHDLRTPMTIISGYAQLMTQSEDEELRQQYSEQMMRQFDVMAAMTREVLAFARGDVTILVRKVYVNKFISDIAQHLRHEFAGKGIELRLDTQYRGVAYFDETKFRRVIHNIGRNAAQAMPNGGSFELAVSAGDGMLKMMFSDSGVGIPAELEGKLFEVFSSAGKKDGTGLGLAIVKKIVEQHNGTVRYRSSRGEGTTFTVTLPLEKSRVSADEGAADESVAGELSAAD